MRNETSRVDVVQRPRRPLPAWMWIPRLLIHFLRDYVKFLRTGSTSTEACINLRRLFRATNGRFNDGAARLTGLLRPPHRLPRPTGILGDMSGSEATRTITTLRRQGVHSFGVRVPTAVCDRLKAWAERTPCTPECTPPNGDPLVLYDRTRLIATKYAFDEQTLLANPEVQRLATDPSILAVAQGYLGCRPSLVYCMMWWSTAYAKQPSSLAAQLFHFDMSQISFIKFFIYVTDVGLANGPHCFVAGSHKRLPAAFRQDRRFTDEEVAQHFNAGRIRMLTGSRGTVLAADTRGLHKGVHLTAGERLVLQLQFSTCNYGANRATIRLGKDCTQEARNRIRRHPYTYSRFTCA